MKSIKDFNLSEKKVLVRVDFNVPLDDQQNITDDTRIVEVLPTLRYAMENGAALILMSHLGRPKGKPAPKYSMAPAAMLLGKHLNLEVKMAPDCIGPEVKKMVDQLKSGEVLMLENLRFYAEEEKNDDEFAQKIAGLCDVYINDAFAVSHRAHASVEAVTKFVKDCGAGFLLKKEIDYFNEAMNNPKRPLVAVVGGAKVSSKLGALKNMLARVNKIIIGGAMANTFLKSQGKDVGKSLVEDELLGEAADIMARASKSGVSLFLPVDAVVSSSPDAPQHAAVVDVENIPKDTMALDIGPKTSSLFSKALSDAQTIIWNGPMGMFETEAFSRGTMEMVHNLANSKALTIVGGGDTDVAVHSAGEAEKISYISTGGGAFLHLMEGKILPGVAALERAAG
ncbi:MAG: phosphoglycerate kinase [Desulfobacterales bacterium]|jgi:phosphoglycerate kinase|nr:phosphoglycerate kinase [Desulfobacterales bacterium]